MNYFLVVLLFNVFPLPKKSGFRESFRFAGDLADRGWNVLVFPEGDLTPDGKLQPFRAGVGLLAKNLRLPVVPMRIDGAYEIREAHSKFNRPGRIRVHIGKPVEFPEDSDPEEDGASHWSSVLRIYMSRAALQAVEKLLFVILSEAKNLSWFLLVHNYLNRREILRFAQNDELFSFLSGLFSLSRT